MEIRELSTDKLTGSVYQPRLQPHRSDRHRLMRSILKNGLHVPIIVLRERGAYLIVCGHRRVEALNALLGEGKKELPDGVARINRGKVKVQAVVLGPVSRKHAAFTGFIENFERMDLSPYEQACCYKAFVDKYGFSRRELAERIPIDRSKVDYMIGAQDGKSLTPKMIQSWKERKLNMGHIRVLYRLREKRKEQLQLYKQILAMRLTQKNAELYCNQLLDPEDRRLDRRVLDRFEKRVMTDPTLQKLIKKKELGLSPSSIGEQLNLKFSDPDDLEDKLEALLRLVKSRRR